MLEIKNVYKTFNAGTVNEKVALQDLNLTLEDGDFVTHRRRPRNHGGSLRRAWKRGGCRGSQRRNPSQ